MKHRIQTFTLAAIAVIGITGCEITSEPVDSSPSTSAAATSASPNLEDVAMCEQITRRIVSTSDRDGGILNTFYTRKFGSLIKQGISAPPGEVCCLNYDYIRDTQDDEPKPLSLGPGKIVGNKIYVPYVQVHQGARPFTKTWVFVKYNGQWLAEDLLTSGRERGNGSMFKELSEM